MSDQKFTKAPWLLADDGSPFVYALNERGCNRFHLSVHRGTHGESGIQERISDEEALANAYLISAAPDLYAALDECVRAVEDFYKKDAPIILRALAALKKLGESDAIDTNQADFLQARNKIC